MSAKGFATRRVATGQTFGNMRINRDKNATLYC